MAVNAWPFENQDTTETQYSWLFRELQDSGVMGSFGTTPLAVTAPGTGMTVSVAAGRCFGRGFVGENTAAQAVTVSAASTAARVDRIVFRFDPVNNTGSLVAVAGTSGSSTPPALQQTDTGLWDVPLALVSVPGGATTITSGNVVDDRTWVGGRVGVWDSAHRPTGTDRRIGRLGWNTSLGAFESWSGSAWVALNPTSLDASVLTSGTLDPARIPGLAGSIITSGTVPFARLPTGTSSSTVAVGNHTHAYSSLTGIPSTFAPAPHGHDWSQINVPGLGSLDGYLSGLAGSIGGKVNAYGDVNVARYAHGPDTAAYGRSVGSSYYAVYMDGGLEFGRNVSSLRYKTDVKPSAADGLDVDTLAAAVLALEPRTYVRKSDEKRHRDLGLIAEEVEEVAPWLVIHEPEYEDVRVPKVGPDGEPERHRNGRPVMVTERRPIPGTRVPEGVAYETTLVVALVGAVQHLAARVEALESAAKDGAR